MGTTKYFREKILLVKKKQNNTVDLIKNMSYNLLKEDVSFIVFSHIARNGEKIN